MKKIRLIIADDHTLVREGMKALMDSVPDLEVVGQAADGYEAIELVRRFNPDVLLLDLVMPQMDGLHVIKEVLSFQPDQRILVLTSFSENERIFQAIQAGALGYLLKDCSTTELIQAIRDTSRDDAYLQPVIARKLIQKIGQVTREKQEPKPLTKREKCVLSLVARGLSNKEIADELFLSERTVDAHMSNILKKLEMANRTQAAIYAMQEGYIKPDMDLNL